MELRRQDRLAFVKLAYHGPSGGGRATNLRALHRALRSDRRGELSLAGIGSERTLRFEFAPLQPIRYREFDIRFELTAASGPAPMPTTRKLALRGADGVVFVADSSRARLDDTMASYREMAQHLTAQRLETISVPLLLQYNHRDAADALSLAELDEALNARRLLAALPAVATRGEGVLESFAAALLGTIGMLSQRNEALNLLGGRDAETWVADTIEGLFGRVTLVAPAPPVEEELQELHAEQTFAPIKVAKEPTLPGRIFQDIATEPITRKLSVKMVEEALAAIAAGTQPAAGAPEKQPGSPVAPAPEPTATPAPSAPATAPPPALNQAAPAQTAAQPRQAAAPRDDSARLARERDHARAELERARGERGRAQERHEALRQAVAVARSLADGAAPEQPLHDLLARLSSVAGARSASLLTPAAGGKVRVVAGLDAGGDPVADAPQAGRLVAALVSGASAPVRREASANPALARALEEAGHSPAPVVAVPLRTGRGLHGVIVLYLDAGAPGPDEELLTLLASAADAVALAIRR
ncbi:MAG: GAF domain-containing protein [Vicinamibacteria bacterium]